MHPLQLLGRLRISTEEFDASCREAWERYEKSRDYLADRFGFPVRVPEDPAQWRRYSMSAIRDVESKARGTLMGVITEALMLPENVGFDLVDEGREWIDGLRATDGRWVSWSSMDRDRFEICVGGIAFLATPAFEATWHGGEKSAGNLDVRELIHAGETFLAEFRLQAVGEFIDPGDAHKTLGRVFEDLDRHLGPPSMAVSNRKIWPTPFDGGMHGWVAATVHISEEQGATGLTISILIRRPSAGRRGAYLMNTLIDEMMKQHLLEHR